MNRDTESVVALTSNVKLETYASPSPLLISLPALASTLQQRQVRHSVSALLEPERARRARQLHHPEGDYASAASRTPLQQLPAWCACPSLSPSHNPERQHALETPVRHPQAERDGNQQHKDTIHKNS
jgi:hypothetical protein